MCVICSNSHVMLGSLILYVSTGEDIITQFLTVLSHGVGHPADNVIVDIVLLPFDDMLYMDNCI